MKRPARLSVWLDIAILVMALAGLALNVLLFVRHLSGGGLAGCGGGSSCEELLNSRWSQVLGIPVTGFGGVVYVGVLVALAANNRRLLAAGLGLLAGAAGWFVFVQAVLVGRFCPWCMTAHGIGAAITLLGCWRLAGGGTLRLALATLGLSAAAAVLGISLLQVFGPRPVTHRVDEVAGAAAGPVAEVHARGTGRKVAFDGGRKVYDVAALPHLGRADAKRVMVEYFDYSCIACQMMRGYLDALMAKHPAEICVVVLPVPLERSCNDVMLVGDNEHPGSCELARLALALWRIRPAAFAALHHGLLDGVMPEAARGKVLELVTQGELDAALRDGWIDELLQANIRDWEVYGAGSRKLPKLLITGKRILHGLPSGEAEFVRVMEHELGL